MLRSRAAEEVLACEQRVPGAVRGGSSIAGGKRGVVDAAGGEATKPHTRASQGVGASGVKRDCGAGSPGEARLWLLGKQRRSRRVVVGRDRRGPEG